MRQVLIKAKELLIKEGYTCVIIKSDRQYVSKDRGVKPLLDFYDSKIDLEGGAAADKVIGKAAAYLYVLLKVKEVYVGVISRPAYEVFLKYNIEVSYDLLVDAIFNRTKTGFCPMETAVKNIDNPMSALAAIKEARSKLQN